MNRTRRLGAVALLIGVTAAMGACSGGDDDTEAAGTEASTTILGSTLSATNPRTEDPAGKGARNDLSGVDCKAEGDRWSLSGRLKNSGEDDAVYTVRAFVASVEDGNVKGSAVKEIEVKAGEELPVEVKDFHTGPADGVHCTVAVNRRPVA